MATAQLSNVLPRVIAILNANPGAWSPSVSGTVGAFPSDDEILAAVLEADEWVATQCYFQSANGALAAPFATTTSISNGMPLPFHHGKVVTVELSNDNAAWHHGIEAASSDDIVNARAALAYVQPDAWNFLFSVANNEFFTTAPYARVTYNIYQRTTALQCDQNEETLIIAKAVELLTKNASPAPFAVYAQMAAAGQAALIRDGVYTAQEGE